MSASEQQVHVFDVCSSVLCRLTGFTIPPPVTSSGSVFSLRLTSDFAVSAHGFKVVYEGKKNIDFFFSFNVVKLQQKKRSFLSTKTCTGESLHAVIFAVDM